jgi:hypothetical protein
MSEWWTYTLTDFLLFSPRTYYRLFELYNTDVWPTQVLALVLGLAILAGTIVSTPWSGRVIAAMLAVFWLIVAWAYLLQRYDTINWAARYFAIGFALEAVLLAWTGIIRNHLRAETGTVAKVGVAIIVYALAIHPLIASLSGRPWTQAEIFGLAPDPTVIATLGVLLAATRPNWHLLILPLLWCAISGLTLWTMESPEAPPMALIAAVVMAVTVMKSLTFRRSLDG